jgi:hypothetical protein
VTPRIIIQEEEEEKQTGYVRPAAGAAQFSMRESAWT